MLTTLTMPKIYEYHHIKFYIYPSDHQPAHVHILKPGSFHIVTEIETNKYEIIFTKKAISQNLIKLLIHIIQINKIYFISKWNEYTAN
jgi:hypothetical protein